MGNKRKIPLYEHKLSAYCVIPPRAQGGRYSFMLERVDYILPGLLLTQR